MRQTFDKRFYTPAGFLRDAARLALDFPHILSAVAGRRVSRPFAEKIMLAVTQVNACRYCSYVHTRMALRSGVSPEELEQLRHLQTRIGEFPSPEATALAFARHYAEQQGKVEPQALRRLRSFYGPRVSQDILAYIRLISVANLAGNTVDAFLSRLHGRPASASNPVGEFVLFLLFAPFVLPLLWLMRRRERTS